MPRWDTDLESTKRRYYDAYSTDSLRNMVYALVFWHSQAEQEPAQRRFPGYGFYGRNELYDYTHVADAVGKRARNACSLLARDEIDLWQFENRDKSIVEVGLSKNGNKYYVQLKKEQAGG